MNGMTTELAQQMFENYGYYKFWMYFMIESVLVLVLFGTMLMSIGVLLYHWWSKYR